MFAISGVSGGSLGAAVFAALVANQRVGSGPKPPDRCPADPGVDITTTRGRAERVLHYDLLSPTVAVMLFSDLFQQFVPYGFLNDRAIALERSVQAAWNFCEEGAWFGHPFRSLWANSPPYAVPLLFLNSTVVETGQRLIAAPVAIKERPSAKPSTATVHSAPKYRSAAVHDSARFTYVSPAGTVRSQHDAGTAWLSLVDGGYFENSGAVTAAEVVRNVRAAAEDLQVVPVVIHISNDPETSAPSDLRDQRKWLNQAVAPVKALLNTRPARGFQAREDLSKQVAAHLYFRLCRFPGETRAEERRQPLPLGWALSAWHARRCAGSSALRPTAATTIRSYGATAPICWRCWVSCGVTRSSSPDRFLGLPPPGGRRNRALTPAINQLTPGHGHDAERGLISYSLRISFIRGSSGWFSLCCTCSIDPSARAADGG